MYLKIKISVFVLLQVFIHTVFRKFMCVDTDTHKCNRELILFALKGFYLKLPLRIYPF